MKFDKDFDFNDFNKKTVLDAVYKSNELFNEVIEEDGIILCKMDKADMLEYEIIFGRSVAEAAKELILFYSVDGTLESGLQVLADKSQKHDGPDYVGYLLITEMRKS